jgi:O-acetyl-ADP-ribose deacetylase (regulator of RNase III)/uncharacterized protein YwgA
MYEFVTGNLLDASTEALINTVNCVGIAGRGVAFQFRHAFPNNFATYVQACKRGELQPGQMLVTETGFVDHPKYIINFPTKRHWKGKSRLEDIQIGLEALIAEIQSRQIRSVALPALGCGLGGLEWSQVRPLIEQAFKALPNVRVLIFEPNDTPEVRLNVSEAPRMTPGRAALVGLVHQYLGGLLDPFVSLLEVHKLMYFLQVSGEPLRLQYKKGPYGPYAENLRHVLKAIDGHLIAGYGDSGDQPEKPLELVPGALQDAVVFLQQHDTTRAHLERVADLVSGFESSFGLELLSTVHWVIHQESAVNTEQVVSAVHGWNVRKQRFSSEQIQLACDVLQQQGWLPESFRI